MLPVFTIHFILVDSRGAQQQLRLSLLLEHGVPSDDDEPANDDDCMSRPRLLPPKPQTMIQKPPLQLAA